MLKKVKIDIVCHQTAESSALKCNIVYQLLSDKHESSIFQLLMVFSYFKISMHACMYVWYKYGLCRRLYILCQSCVDQTDV